MRQYPQDRVEQAGRGRATRAEDSFFSVANRIGYALVRLFASVVIWPYFRIRLEGREHLIDGPLIVAPNHCSYIDPVVLQTPIQSRRMVFLMTRTWYEVWYLKPFFLLMKAIPVEDEARNRKALERALEVLRRGVPVGIFPEGQISLNGELSPFSPGVASLALRAGVPIVPAAIVGSARALPKGKFWPRPRKVIIRLGPALFPLSGEQAQGLSRREVMEELTLRLKRAVRSLL